MTGAEQLTVWLVGIVLVTAAVSSAVKAWSAARVEVAKAHAQAQAHVDAYQIVVRAQAGQLTVPPAWMQEEGL